MASDPRLARLFAEPPERFTAARDALATELASAGDRDTAAEVRRLRRPTRRVWLLNRLARAHPGGIARLLDAGSEVKRANAAALRGEHSTLRAADLALGRALDGLVEEARQEAIEADHPASHALLMGIRTDLRTLATGRPDAAERLRSGTLEHVPAYDSEDLLAELAAGMDGAPRPATHELAVTKRRTGRDAREQRAERAAEEAEARHAERAVAAARRALDRAEREAARADEVARDLRRRADDARKALDAARARLSEARRGLVHRSSTT